MCKPGYIYDWDFSNKGQYSKYYYRKLIKDELRSQVCEYENHRPFDNECKIENYFKNNPRSRIVLISCNCPKCRREKLCSISF